jgi:hypothetical protein
MSSQDPPSGAENLVVYSNDPVARFLIARMRLTPVSFALITLFVMLILHVGVSAYFGVLTGHSGGVRGFLDDPAGMIIYLVAFPATSGYYLWISQRPKEIISRGLVDLDINCNESQLEQEGCSDKKSDTCDGSFSRNWNDKMWPRYAHSYWLRVSILVVLLSFVVAKLTDLGGPGNRAQVSQVWAIVSDISILIGWYFICMIVARELVTIQNLRWLFGQHDLRLYPLHPDKCGGLSPVSRYAMAFTYYIALAGLTISFIAFDKIQLGQFATQYFLHVAILAYLALAFACFFLPLDAAHDAMSKAKNEWLLRLSREFQDKYERAQGSSFASENGLHRTMEEIEQIQRLYRLTDEFPVWPFDTLTLRRFVATVAASLSPILISMVSVLIRRVFGLP